LVLPVRGVRGRGRVRILVLSLLLGAGLVAPISPPAHAAVPPVSSRTGSVVTADALPTAQVNGVVWTSVITGSRLFAAGEFTQARPAGSAAGTGERRRWNLASVNLSTGALNAFAPQFNGPVRALAVSTDGSTLFVGGNFTKVGPYTRNRFAAFRISTGALLTKNPSFNATVTSFAVSSSTVYVGGYFTTVNGVSRSRLAALQVTSGALTSWAPKADSTVRALTLTGDKTKVIAGGHFNYVNGLTGRGLVALDARTGARRTWRINGVVKDYGPDAAILSLAADTDTVYGTGYAFGAGNFEGVFAADDTAGDVRWIQDCHGDTYDVAQTAGAIYSVGHPHFCGNIGGYPETGQANPQRTLAMTRTARGTVAPNTEPGRSGNFAGHPAPSLFNWFPALRSGTYTGLGQGAWTVAASTSYVVLAGEFTEVNGRPQQGMVRFTLPSIQDVRTGPVDRSAATAPTVAAGAGGTARVSWRANWDRDELTIGYDVLRDNIVVGQVTRQSTFWNRPTVAFTDRGLVAGRTYSYRIRARHRVDPVTSPAVAFTYTGAAAADVERMSAAGTPTTEESDTAKDPVQPQPLSGPLALTGAPEAVPTGDRDEPGPEETTLRVRLRTSVAGGTVAAFGPQDSTTRTRRIGLDEDGRLVLAVAGADGKRPVDLRSESAVTDGRWHHVVAVAGRDELRLYLDGEEVTARSVTPAAPGAGRWWLGGGLTGDLDEVAVFDEALSPAEVTARHQPAGR
jgi:hypothetical protein